MDIEIGSESFHQISDLICFSGISIPDALNVGESGEYVNVKFSYQSNDDISKFIIKYFTILFSTHSSGKLNK